MHNDRHRWLAVPLTLLVAAIDVVAAPKAAAQSTYPDISKYRDAGSLEKFKVYTGDGIWFSTPLGLYCSIGDDSSFGCSGKLAGTPAGENEVAWFPGDPFPRLYYTDAPRFNSGLNQQLLAAFTVVSYRGTRCGINMERRTGVQRDFLPLCDRDCLCGHASGAGCPPPRAAVRCAHLTRGGGP
jgi:hypothetical protein